MFFPLFDKKWQHEMIELLPIKEDRFRSYMPTKLNENQICFFVTRLSMFIISQAFFACIDLSRVTSSRFSYAYEQFV